MSRPIRLHANVQRPLMAAERAFRLEPTAWLPAPHDHATSHRWAVYLWAGRIGLLVDTIVGECRREYGTLRRLVRLEPDPSTFLGRHAPSFTGDLVIGRDEGSTVVVLEGRYQPPYGVVGDLLDWLLLHTLARATARRFVTETAARLTVAGNATPSTVCVPDRQSAF
jgi:hypothetical protein